MGAINSIGQRDLRQPLPGRRRWTGFTLTELMVAVAVVGILAAFAAPSFSDMIARQRTRTAATDLYLALAKARSEAIKRNTSVTLSPKGGNWASGWEIANPSDASAKLEDHGAVANATITGPASVVYLTTGRIRGSTRPEFDISVTGTSAHACVSVDLSGLPTQKSSSC
ncbi:MAG TPA: GspH/FimT family pseudopilin [Noviherbaspirillum sp.]